MLDATSPQMSTVKRRAAVTIVYTAFFLAVVVWTICGDLKPWPIAATVAALLGISSAALFVLLRNRRYWRWGVGSDRHLDEFEIATRNAAHKRAYTLIAALTLVGLLIAMSGFDELTEPARVLIIGGWLLAVVTLPSAMLAWVDRPVPEED